MKRLIERILQGIPQGVLIGFSIALVFSFIYRVDHFVPSSPDFVAQFSSNTVATFISALLWAAMGGVFSGASLIFEKETWSITRQTIWHFIITYLGFTPLAVLAGWFPWNLPWLGGFTLIFIAMYILQWIIYMFVARRQIEQLNHLVKSRKK
jgi:hypothetical protein